MQKRFHGLYYTHEFHIKNGVEIVYKRINGEKYCSVTTSNMKKKDNASDKDCNEDDFTRNNYTEEMCPFS